MLKVVLAGHNVDTDVLKKLKSGKWDGKKNVTPETISAAYARISRDARPVTKLREIARDEVDKARKSNENIVFKMGHHSVAEHAYLNFDIIGLSRLAVESLEEARLCSYTEKSQRYITLDGDYVMPAGLNAAQKKLFRETVRIQVDGYNRAFPVLHEYQKEHNSGKLATKAGQNMVEGWAKEDARYMVSLATECQLGFSTNARNLEHIIRKLKYSPLAEVRKLAEMLYDKAESIVPSLIILSDPKAFKKQFGWEVSDGFLNGGREKLAGLSRQFMKKKKSLKKINEITLSDWTRDADTKVMAALLHSASDMEYSECITALKKSKSRSVKFIKSLLKDFTAFDAMPREFEAVNFLFDVVISAGAFGQMKRHRMMSVFKQPYDISLGVTVPPSIEKTGLEKMFMDVMKASEHAYKKIRPSAGRYTAEYALTNAHRRRILINANLRELYHMARLRMDSHAQWDIQQVTGKMIKELRKKAPVTAALACGKDRFKEAYREFFK